MSAALRLVDETSTGTRLRELRLEVASERITAREVIERRVRHEIAEFERRGTGEFPGLIQPMASSERRRCIDADAQVACALEAFEHNGFLMLSEEHQIESLDDVILVTPGARITFVKLVPLVGG